MNFRKIAQCAILVPAAALMGLTLGSCEDDYDENAVLFGRYSMEGTVSTPEGEPVEGATVTVHNVEIAEKAISVTTDAAGHYEIKNHRGTQQLVVMVEAEGYHQEIPSVLTVDYSNPTSTSLGEASMIYDVVIVRD